MLIIEDAAHYGYFLGFLSVSILDPENLSEGEAEVFRGNHGIVGHFETQFVFEE